MMEKKTWDEFAKSGLLWWINRTLHIFGWAIVFQSDGIVYPARVKYRGFCEVEEENGFQFLTKYLRDTSPELYKEINEPPK